MREIKFRAWAKAAKALYEPDFFSGGVNFYNPDLIFMQFTGFKDKNGKEIYEGDILLYNDTESEYVDVGIGGKGVKVAEQEVNSMAAVSFKDGEFGITPNSDFGETLQNGHWYSLRYLMEEELEWTEVIGNIYENPELLI